MFGPLDQLRRPAPQNGAKWIYGAWVATGGLMAELLRHGIVETIDCFAPTGARRSQELAGRPCREIPFDLFPLEAPRQRYGTLFSYFGWNSGLPSLRARYLPQASHVQLVHSMHHERTLWDFGCNFLWELFQPADALVCTSPTAVRTLQSMIDYWRERALALRGARIDFPARVVEIPLATDLPSRRIDRDAARDRLGWGDEMTILVLGRLSSFDKMDYGAVLAMLRRLSRRSSRPLQFVLAGEDTERAAEKLLTAARRMQLAGGLRIYANIDFDLREDLYAASDVFLSLADHVQETFGLTILEAMAHGLPVVASDWGGYRDLVLDGRTGLLVPTMWGGRIGDLGDVASIDAMTTTYALSRRTAFDSNAAERALLALIDNAGTRRAMGEAGRRRAIEHFSWPGVIDRYRALWQELAEIRARNPVKRRKLPVPRGHDYNRLFGHYPSRRVGPGDRVTSRITASEALSNSSAFLFSNDDEKRGLSAIVSAVADGPRPLSACVRQAAKSAGLPTEIIEDHLLLAAKYGLVDVEPRRTRRR